MFRLLSLCTLLLTLLTSTALADVTIKLLNPKTGMVRITYTILDIERGATEMTFPPSGFDFAAGPLKVLAAYDVKTMEILDAEPAVVGDKSFPTAVHVKYKQPVRAGEQKQVRFTFDVPSTGFGLKDELWSLEYTTSHLVRFMVPSGHELVSTNTPVKIEEEAGRPVAVSDPKWDDRRAIKFEFKTRPLR